MHRIMSFFSLFRRFSYVLRDDRLTNPQKLMPFLAFMPYFPLRIGFLANKSSEMGGYFSFSLHFSPLM